MPSQNMQNPWITASETLISLLQSSLLLSWELSPMPLIRMTGEAPEPLALGWVSCIAQGTTHNKDSIQYCCCPSSSVLLEKFVSHGICSSVSLSLTVPRHWVKCRGVTSSSLSVIARMTTLHKDKACSSFLGASWLPCISKKMHAYICMHIYINYNIWNQSGMQIHLKK